jgi:hypothetical protein
VHDTLDHPALGQSPREAFAAARRTSGERPQRAVVYDEEFWLWTFPTTARGKARVVPGRGVKVNYIFYWSSAFRDPAVEQTLVPVRYDPYNAGTAFAYVGTRWVECLSEHYASLRGRSERELMVASAELRKRAQTHARQYAMTARRLADFLTSVEAEELLRAQRLRDREAHSVLRLIDGSIGTLPPGSARDASDASRDATPRQRASIPSMSSAPTLHPDQLHVYEEY